MVMTPDPALNLRADIKATLHALIARIQIGGNWRSCADQARELGHKLDALAELEQTNDGPRQRVIETPPPPASGDEFLGPRLAWLRRAAQARHARRTDVTEVRRTPPALPDGA